MKKFKAAVIGCGRAGSLFDLDEKRQIIASHCGAYKNNKKTELIALCDQDEEKLSTSSKFWEVKKTYLDYKNLFDSVAIDVVSICTMPESHYEIASYALKSGVKAIYCEKPIATSLKDAKKLIEICKKKDVCLVINHQRRWTSQFINLKQLIHEKEFGEIQHINFYYTRGVFNSGSHLFDLMRMLFGEVSSVLSTSSIRDFNQEQTISGLLNFTENLSAQIIGLNGNHYRVFDLEIFFSKAKLYIDSSLDILISESEVSSRTNEFLELSKPKKLNLNKDSESPMIKAVSEIVGKLEKGNSISCTGEDGYKSLEIILSLQESLRKKKEISLPLGL